jgi:hypothetical protein
MPRSRTTGAARRGPESDGASRCYPAGLLFAVTRLLTTERKGMRAKVHLIRESATALLYVIIVAAMTLLYVDYNNIELLKHPIDTLHALSAVHDQADED